MNFSPVLKQGVNFSSVIKQGGNFSPVLKWVLLLLLVMSLGWKSAVRIDYSSNLEDKLRSFLVRNHFLVTVSEEIIRDHQSTFVVRQSQIVRPGICAEVEDAEHLGRSGLRRIEHHDLARLIHGDEEPLAVAGHAHELRPAAGGDGFEVEYGRCGPGTRVDQIQLVIEHTGRVSAAVGVIRN